MADEPLIAPRSFGYHDAPDPARPYEVESPVFFAVGLVIAVLAVVDPLRVLAAFCGFTAAVANTPRLLRWSLLSHLDRRLRVRAQRRRLRRLRWWQRKDRILVRVMNVSRGFRNVGVGVGVALILSSPIVYFVLDTVLIAEGLVICVLACVPHLLVLNAIYDHAITKGDEATGPMRYRETSVLADWMERNPERTDDIQRWAIVLGCIFAVAPVVIGIGS
jgi:hypothetical protein